MKCLFRRTSQLSLTAVELSTSGLYMTTIWPDSFSETMDTSSGGIVERCASPTNTIQYGFTTQHTGGVASRPLTPPRETQWKISRWRNFSYVIVNNGPSTTGRLFLESGFLHVLTSGWSQVHRRIRNSSMVMMTMTFCHSPPLHPAQLSKKLCKVA